ncbi:MAG: Ig-like domain-containing protein, partial [Bacillus sp. (in: Bacteria)]|nr:Ig-like domain-containing protein [Bacillus sp. (in: firmicutes)]
SVTRFSCGKNAFYCCVSLRSITLPGLGPWEECFVNCYNLCVSFNFESNYSSAYMEEFIDNSNIKEIHIPDCVESIGDYDLRGCTGAIIKIYSTDIDEIGEGAFDGCKEVQVIKGSKTHKYCKAHKIKVKTFDPYAPSGIALKASGSTLLTPKKGIQLTATLSPSNARSKLTWKSSKKSVATVSKNGYVKAKKKGTTTITVKTRNGKKASIKITVKANPKKVTLSSKSLALSVGKTAQLTATLPKNTYATLSYSSSNAGVAKVDQSGKVTAVKGGQTTITVTTSNGKKASCLVTVLSGPAPTTLTLNATNCVLKPKGKFTIVPKINSGASTAYTYSTSNKKVATVAADGTIKAKKKGKAVITVRTHNGLTATVNVTVKAK